MLFHSKKKVMTLCPRVQFFLANPVHQIFFYMNSRLMGSCLPKLVCLESFQLSSVNFRINFKPHTPQYNIVLLAEVESSRTSLASRTHFEVLGLGLEGQVLGLGLSLEASSPRKLACPRLEDSTSF